MPKNKFYRSGVGSNGFRNGCTTAKKTANQIQKNQMIITNTYTLKLLSSGYIRNTMMREFPILCSDKNCKGKISVETKWWWVFDKYKLTIEGTPKDVNTVELSLNKISTL